MRHSHTHRCVIEFVPCFHHLYKLGRRPCDVKLTLSTTSLPRLYTETDVKDRRVYRDGSAIYLGRHGNVQVAQFKLFNVIVIIAVVNLFDPIYIRVGQSKILDVFQLLYKGAHLGFDSAGPRD